MPVSLIGTFVVLLAVGYSANSVSLLAMVLAIGIVVDDAIVVVENVERVMEEHPELSPAEATKRAMAEITAPIIAITLVLLSVFVPVAFIPGISGELFRQFAVTVAVSMFLSAINALTLSPALCAVLLRPHHGPRRGPIGRGDALDRPRARRLWRRGRAASSASRSSDWRWSRSRASASSDLLEDHADRLPAGGRPGRIVRRGADCPAAPRSRAPPRWSRQAEAMLREEEAVADYTSVIGLNFIDNYSQPNAAFMVVTLKPFEERKDRSTRGAGADRAARRQAPRRSRAAPSFRWRRRRSSASARAAASPMSLQDLRGGDPKELAQAVRGLIVAANQDPQLSRVFSTFSATNPSIYLDIDRDKVQILGVPLSDVFQALAGVARRLSTSTT